MVRHYILNGLVFVETKPKYTTSKGMIIFIGHVYRFNPNPDSFDICGIKLKDEVEISLPENTPYISF